VASCRNLRASVGEPSDWTVEQASVLDPALDVQQAQVVYSWGVLHHTGDMWTAIRNAARLVAPGRLFVIALYNAGHSRLLTVERWRRIKRLYNRLPRVGQAAMEWLYLLYQAQGELRQKRSLGELLRRPRGMDFRTDVRDWLGGYPYEAATVDEVTGFVAALGFTVERVVVPDTPEGFSNNEFVFRRH
jgi:2-polyprenyl-6-hydroxyphenyl methylase/3-demethylubiquinone-9 3-methyltransferase